jgi:hypothetical protein
MRGVSQPPPEYADNFIKGGWRLVERLYGARTLVHIKWLHICGFRINQDGHYELDGKGIRELRRELKG